jgi:hypothetical protein
VTRAERRRLLRELGVPSKKMKRRRPVNPVVQEAFRQAVRDRVKSLESA